ncbi:hypothetical protein ACH5RR_012391 [Cinchona calisaya]|uniref:RNase H type-1 domain-containing protein n=1 Tax=Cinchona calisaya TaxID=153742 RepID=A0ABD3A7I5_9GENT
MLKGRSEREEFHEANDKISHHTDRKEDQSNQLRRWKPPSENTILINTDVAPRSKEIVATNFRGILVNTWAIPNSVCRIPIMEEALSVKQALLKAKQQEWDSILQSDCKNLMDKINNEVLEDAQLGGVLVDIVRIKKWFKKRSSSFIPRGGNHISHNFAKFALSLCKEVMWKESFPFLVGKHNQS